MTYREMREDLIEALEVLSERYETDYSLERDTIDCARIRAKQELVSDLIAALKEKNQ